ncbi:DUF1569 domain-containing protein [Ferruginibacter profundus]
MQKNLFNATAIEKMIARVNRLDSNTRPQWGIMTATEMLLHCNLCNNQILDGETEYCKPGFKKKLVKFLALYIVPQFPKYMKAAERNITTGKVESESFNAQKQIFIATLNKFSENVAIDKLPHPAFGVLNKNEWGIAAWKHTDHHLRQFNL